MPLPPYYTKFSTERIDWRSNMTEPVQYSINDPPEPAIDLRQELAHWETILGYCTTQVKRLEEQLFMQHAEIAQKDYSVNEIQEVDPC